MGKLFVIDQLADGEVVTTYKPNKFWLEAPYEPTLLGNYEKYGALDYRNFKVLYVEFFSSRLFTVCINRQKVHKEPEGEKYGYLSG